MPLTIRPLPGTPPRGTPGPPYPAAPSPPRRSTLAPLFLLFLLGATVAGFIVHVVFIPLPVLAVWSQPARFEIRSDPSGAEVYLDGQRLYALTPTYTEVRRDRRLHTVELRKEGFETTLETCRYDRSAKLEVVVSLVPGARPPGARPPVEPVRARRH
jgi:hypothetical protein